MNCEVVAVGTELLLGQIVDTNSSWIGEQLALAGIDSYLQTKVGDNWGRIRTAISDALERSDAVIVCGGLGPTQDDITRDVIAEVMGVPLEEDPEVVERLMEIFGSHGRTMPANNLRQAMVPVGATRIAQQPGTAPGLICPVGDKVVFAVPGVPYEMKEMVTGTVLPELRRRAGDTGALRSRTLRTWGQSESGLAEILAPRIDELDQQGHATIAFLASGIEGLKVRVTAKADTGEEADAVLEREVELLTEVLGDIVFSTDDDTMEVVVNDLLRTAGLSVGVAESLTGGLVASRLTAAPGASDVVRGGVVAYASDVKFDLLGVPEGPVVTEECAAAMAEGICRVVGSDVGLATTGVAGPTAQEGVQPGTVFIASHLDGVTETAMMRLPGGRDQVAQYTVISLLDHLRRRLLAR
ncbi:competence/damage-inducible protein A [Rhabdothermincola salaria]|uniref:competence/damage-inducible protein A n=1 Tax=Rhabdothermincola salaria TaxID=2903142 RepID=UPI001E51FF63|nr:competence/damage-inducible protein A [Rhabdothermincola salaria]